jgi:hypothetical protein
LYGVVNGEAKGFVVVVDVVGVVKEAGRGGAEGGVVVGVVAVAVAVVELLTAVEVDVDEMGAGEVAAVAAAMVPLCSQGFGGEPMSQIRVSECTGKETCQLRLANSGSDLQKRNKKVR